jgi:hypothetical protein
MGEPITRTSTAFIMRMPHALLEALRNESDKRKMPVSAIVMEALGEDRMPLGRATSERLLEAEAAKARASRQKIARAITEERQRRREDGEDAE